MAFDPKRAEAVAGRITGTGALILLVASGLAFGLVGALAALGAIILLFGLSLYMRLPPPA
jgi:hypothetical protein